MAAASIAKHLQFDYLTHTDPFRALQGFEALEQAFLEPETQMEFGGTPNSNNTVEVSNGSLVEGSIVKECLLLTRILGLVFVFAEKQVSWNYTEHIQPESATAG